MDGPELLAALFGEYDEDAVVETLIPVGEAALDDRKWERETAYAAEVRREADPDGTVARLLGVEIGHDRE